MDISELIKFKPPGDDGRPSKVKITSLYNRPIRVTRWSIMDSRFHDGNPRYADVDIETLDTGESLRFNTGSKVIISQLQEIAEALDKARSEDRTFTAVIRSMGDFVKMYPCKEANGIRRVAA